MTTKASFSINRINNINIRRSTLKDEALESCGHQVERFLGFPIVFEAVNLNSIESFNELTNRQEIENIRIIL